MFGDICGYGVGSNIDIKGGSGCFIYLIGWSFNIEFVEIGNVFVERLVVLEVIFVIVYIVVAGLDGEVYFVVLFDGVIGVVGYWLVVVYFIEIVVFFGVFVIKWFGK